MTSFHAISLCLLFSLSACAQKQPGFENNLHPIGQNGQDSGSAKTIYQRMKEIGVPGVSIALFDGGRIVFEKAYGTKDQSAPVDTNTLFQAASISKPLTSVATFRLYERGIIPIDTDVNTLLQGWKVPDTVYDATEKVTVRRIISHMGGLSVHGFRGYKRTEQLPTIIQTLNGVPPSNSPRIEVDTTPGVIEIYSGGGFVILQLLLQEKTQKPFAQILSEEVLRPAGMIHSTFVQPLPDSLIPFAAKGFQSNGKPVAGGFHVYPEQAPAGLWTTPSDLARFMLRVGDAYRDGDGLIKQSTARMMLTRVPNGSGEGFGLDGDSSTLRFRHSGGNFGYTCYAISFAGTGKGIIVMTNSDNGSNLIHEIVRAISKEYGWGPLWPGEH